MLWRTRATGAGIEVALVHRPGRDGWSLPKGKLHAGEHPVIAALREVREETCFRASLGPALGTTNYFTGGRAKRVRYWSMAATDGEFAPSVEIDDLIWVPLDAAARVTRRRDLPVIERFGGENAHQARPLLLVPPAMVRGPDKQDGQQRRPLGGRGRRQANALAGLIEAFGVRRALIADARHCAETLRPFEKGSDVRHEAVLPVREKGARARAAVDHVLEVAQEGVPTVVCAETGLLARLSDELTAGKAHVRRRISTLPHGSLLVLHLDGAPGRRGGRVMTTERIRAAV